MGSYSRFEMFMDCLWGLTFLLAWHLLPFSFFRAQGLRSLVTSPAMLFHATILVTFAYIFGLRLRRNLLPHLYSGADRRRAPGHQWSVDE